VSRDTDKPPTGAQSAGPAIRPATPRDCGLILGFVRELAEYEREPDAVVATEQDLQRVLFGDDARVECLVAEVAGEPAGIALYFYNFSTWTGRYGIYLEDLYVTPGHRGRGAGLALLRHLAGIAVDRGCARFEWSVLDWNQPAIDFYESCGARPMREWVGYRLDGDALRDFAGK
jgi:GNAT superfamily N-acetyltransferase